MRRLRCWGSPIGRVGVIHLTKTTRGLIMKWLWIAAISLGAGVLANSPANAQAGQTENGAAQAESIADDITNDLIVLSDAHWHKGEYNHVVNLLRMVVAGQPDNVEIYGNAGWLLWSMNKDPEAVALYEQGIKANPNTYYMYDELGFYYFNRKKDYLKAIQYYSQAAKLSDVKPGSLHLLAHAYERTGQMKLCLETWERAVKMPGPENAAAKVNLTRVKGKMK
jgi:tetratricopeptide (TPR) repeat protein